MTSMSPIRTPECNGKVERYHGCLRTEAGLPETGTVEDYHWVQERSASIRDQS